MYEPFENLARELHMCPCCQRAFTPDEEDEFVKKVPDLIIDITCCLFTLLELLYSYEFFLMCLLYLSAKDNV